MDRDEFPSVSLVLATHNLTSARRAMTIRQEQAQHKEPRVDMICAQQLGMADNVTGELVCSAEAVESQDKAKDYQELEARPAVAKYLVWGPVGDCTKYLVRRAQENSDAVKRTDESRKELWAEFWRRLFGDRRLQQKT